MSPLRLSSPRSQALPNKRIVVRSSGSCVSILCSLPSCLGVCGLVWGRGGRVRGLGGGVGGQGFLGRKCKGGFVCEDR